MLNLFLAITNATALAGIEVEWAAEPASATEPGSVRVGLVLVEEELLFVSSDTYGETGESFAFFEAVASIDGELNTRSSGRKPLDGEPLEVTLVIDGVMPGTHELTVSLSDRESGQSWEWESSIDVPLSSEGWNSAALQITTGRTLRADEDFHAYWEVFPPGSAEASVQGGEEDLRVAYAVRSSGGEVFREGWFSTSTSSASGGVRAEVDIDMGGLQAGEYQLLAVTLSESGEIVTSAARGFTLLRAWDVWGEDPDETSRLIWPIARPSEVSALRDAESVEERRAVMTGFWSDRDPSPSTGDENEYLDLYLSRLDVADERYSYLGRSGVSTDRGRIYLLMGEPDQVQDYPFETESVPYQVWTYYSPPAVVVFVDNDGSGVYELYNDWQEVLGAVTL